jgi:hypothetical protein
LRFQIDDLVVEEDRAVATVERVSSAPASGVPISGASAPRPATERFQIAAGQVVAYWPAPADPDATRALPPLTVPLWLGSKQVAIARFAFPPGAALVDLDAPGPHLLFVETGELTVSLDGQAEIARRDEADGWRPTTPTERLLALRSGDALLVPDGIHHTIRNATTAGASMLGLLIYSDIDLTGNQRQPRPTPALLLSIYGSSPFSLPEKWNGDVSTELLARGVDICAARETSSLRATWLSLASGQSIAPHRVVGAELLAAKTGALLVGQAHPAVTLDPNAHQPEAAAGSGLGIDAAPGAQVVMAGDAVAFSTGLSGAVANTGTEPARLLLVAVGPPNDIAPQSPGAAAGLTTAGPCQPNPPEDGGQ